ncbi:unnamed protein product [Trichobilharzia szidati]|nr:unnamed protein product [Trichobilharzia szidati]
MTERTSSMNKTNKRLQQTQAQVNEVVDIMRVNVDKVLERDKNLSELDGRADALQAGASQFEASAGKLKRKFWWKNCKMLTVLALLVLILIIVLIVWIVSEQKNEAERKSHESNNNKSNSMHNLQPSLSQPVMIEPTRQEKQKLPPASSYMMTGLSNHQAGEQHGPPLLPPSSGYHHSNPTKFKQSEKPPSPTSSSSSSSSPSSPLPSRHHSENNEEKIPLV